MWLVLTEPFDPSGAWLSAELASRSGEEVQHLTSSDIAAASQADRGVDDEGVWFRVVTSHGRVVDSRKLKGVVNRVCSSPSVIAQAVGRNQVGVPRSLGAPLMRWLHRWPGPVLNRPNVDGLSGDFRPTFWWLDHAIKAGFSAPRPAPEGEERPAPHANTVSILLAVVGEDIHALDSPSRIIAMSLRSRCRRLAQAAGASILGIEAAPTPTGEWTFLGASLRPDLVRGGDAVVRSVSRALGLEHEPNRSIQADQLL